MQPSNHIIGFQLLTACLTAAIPNPCMLSFMSEGSERVSWE